MADELTTLGIAVGGAFATKETLNKLLGPTADYLGEGAKDLVKKSTQNLGKIFSAACHKVKEQLDKKGQVSPRVLKSVWDEGRFVEDTIVAEYFGGLLACSRSEDGSDDGMLPHLSLIKTMSSGQLRLHYVVYSLVASLPFGREKPAHPELFDGLVITIQSNELLAAMCSAGACDDRSVFQAILGLVDLGLLESRYAFSMGLLHKQCGSLPVLSGQTVLCPNRKGADLFLKALGFRGLDSEIITSVVTEDHLTDSVKQGIRLPCDFKYAHILFSDSVESIHNDLKTMIGEVEDEVENLKSELDDRTTFQ